jgi:glutamate synthase (NADPH/NADH) small chain
MNNHVIKSAHRCLQCKNPLCEKGCPISTPIKKMIEMFNDGEIKEAGKMLFENNPLSVICSLVCPHEKHCEGHCVLGRKGEPVNIGGIENYISDYHLNRMQCENLSKGERSVAIIGGGPAGISLAIILAKKGYDITIFDGHDKIGGVLRYRIPDFRLNKNILDILTSKMKDLGIKIRPNIMVGKGITFEDLFRDGFGAIFIGTGVWIPRALGIKGESLGHVHYAINYLKNPDVYDLGKKVVVIGAGNVAMDVARTAIRKGADDVRILYRKGFDEMPARKDEIEFAKIDGVRFETYKTPISIDKQGVNYNLVNKVQDGDTIKFETDDSVDYFIDADSVLIAVSQNPMDLIVENNEGISTTRHGLLVTDECGRTTRDGVFASGDVVTGAKTVVEAAAFSKRAAMAIEKYFDEK